jgi:hypothetical protein
MGDARGNFTQNRRTLLNFVLLVVVSSSAAAAAGGSMSIVAKLTESDGQQGFDSLGVGVAMDGNTVVAGDPVAGGIYNTDEGAAYVFVKPSGGWRNMTQTAKLTASDGVKLDDFGQAVAIRGDVIVVGAPNKGLFETHKNYGAVYVFVKPPGGWSDMTETAELTASDDNTTSGLLLGTSVAVNAGSNTIFAGAPGKGSNGAIYTFVEPHRGWAKMTQTAELNASDSQNVSIGLGGRVAVDGDVVVDGAIDWPNAESDQCCLGAVYVWVRPAKGWKDMTETARLTSLDSQVDDELGYGVSLIGNTLVAGAPGVTVNGKLRQGAAYVFVEPKGGWKTTSRFKAKLEAFDGQGGDSLAVALAAQPGAIVLGATGYNGFEGATYLYVEPAGGWKTTSRYNAKKQDPADQPDAFFGAYIGLQNDFGAVGAYLEKPTGAAYVYRVRP